MRECIRMRMQSSRRTDRDLRRRFCRGICCALTLLAGILLTSCGGEEEVPKKTRTELILWHYWDIPAMRQKLTQLAEEYNASQDQVTIEPEYVPDEDFRKTLALAAADGRLPDLVLADCSDVRYFDRMSPLADLSEVVDRGEYLDQALELCEREDGTLIGLPLGLNCLTLYYNKGILQRSGVKPPQTFQEFLSAAKAMTSGQVYGCGFAGLISEETTYSFLPILWNYGADLKNLDTPEGEAAFNFLKELVQSGAVSKSAANMTMSDVARQFSKGNIAMIFAASGKMEYYFKQNPQLRYAQIRIPGAENRTSVIGGEVLVVPDQARREKALDFIRFLAQPQQIKSYLEAAGYLSPRRDVLEWQMEKNPERKKERYALEHARMREQVEYWPAISIALAETVNQTILQNEPQDAWQKLADRIDQIRGEYDEGE
ncbi:ABC transporter substrate-binding protein [Brotaphodocola sp.]|uniref:ABC transporter substrate-binding protein n=1 Tax=Brotaphodocola sp. TaxID=3073577 RepID=UPI003D7D4945